MAGEVELASGWSSLMDDSSKTLRAHGGWGSGRLAQGGCNRLACRRISKFWPSWDWHLVLFVLNAALQLYNNNAQIDSWLLFQEPFYDTQVLEGGRAKQYTLETTTQDSIWQPSKGSCWVREAPALPLLYDPTCLPIHAKK